MHITWLNKVKVNMFILLSILISFFWINLAWGINFSANWHSVKTSEPPSSFSKSYSLSFSHSLSRTMFLTGSMRYMRNDQGDRYREMIMPSVFYTLTTDLFNYNLGLSSSQAKSKNYPTLENYSITNTFSTNIKKVNIGLFFNMEKNWNNLNPKTIDNKNESWGLNLSHRFYKYLKNLSINYAYRFNKVKDYITNSKTKTSSHSFNWHYFKTIKNLNFGIEQRYSISTTESWYALISGQAKIYVNLITNGTLPSVLYDTNETVIKIPYPQSIEGIEFYTDYTNRTAIPSTVIFDIYYSNNGITWTLLATNVSLPYTFSSPVSYTWIKLVVKTGAGNPVSGGINLPDPRIVGFYYTKQNYFKRKNVYWTTSGNISYALPKGIRASYFGYYEVQKPEPGNKRTIQSHSFYTYWQGTRYFRPSFRFNITRSKEKDKPETKSFIYSLSVGSTPIDTVNLSGGYTNNKYYEGNTKIFNSQTYALSGVFNIFPDFTLRSTLSYNIDKNYISNLKQNTYGSNIDMFVRLRPNLTTDFRINYTHSKNTYSNSTNTSGSTKRCGILIDWGISRALHFTSSQYLSENSVDNKVSYMFFYNIYFAPWRKVRLNTSYSGIRDDQKVDNISIGLIWYVAYHINFNTSYNWNRVKNNTSWSWNWSVNFTF